MKIIFINLADKHPLGETAVKALKIKHGEDVHQFNWMEHALSFKNGKPFLKVQRPSWLDNQTQLIIAAHGEENDTNHIFHEIEFEQQSEKNPVEKLFDYTQLADFIDELLDEWHYSDKDNSLPIALSICYAARTTDYMKDHIAEAGSLNFTETFAYKFLKVLHHKLHSRNCTNEIILKAYTGAVSFNESTGELVVQTEEEILREREKNRLREEQAQLEHEIEKHVLKTSDAPIIPVVLIDKHEKLIEKREALLLAAKPPQPNYGEAIYTSKENGDILIDTNNLTQNVARSREALPIADTQREHPAAAPLPDLLLQLVRSVCPLL